MSPTPPVPDVAGVGRASSQRARRPSSKARSRAAPAVMYGSCAPVTRTGTRTRSSVGDRGSPRWNEAAISIAPPGAGREPEAAFDVKPFQTHRERRVPPAGRVSVNCAAGQAPPPWTQLVSSTKYAYDSGYLRAHDLKLPRTPGQCRPAFGSRGSASTRPGIL